MTDKISAQWRIRYALVHQTEPTTKDKKKEKKKADLDIGKMGNWPGQQILGDQKLFKTNQQ